MIKSPALIMVSFLTFSIHVSINAQTDPQAIVDKFFSIYSQDPIKAVDFAFSTNKWLDRRQNYTANLKNKLQNLIGLSGEYFGYEQLTEKTVGTSLMVKSFLVKYERQPIRFTFSFYKPNETWIVYNFSYDVKVSDELEEAAKMYRLKQFYE